jgi:hypothetical protein
MYAQVPTEIFLAIKASLFWMGVSSLRNLVSAFSARHLVPVTEAKPGFWL